MDHPVVLDRPFLGVGIMPGFNNWCFRYQCVIYRLDGHRNGDFFHIGAAVKSMVRNFSDAIRDDHIADV